MQTHNERGVALVLALFLVAALSVLGASLMFLSQTETYASMNYRLMSQARYAAESGVHRTAAFLLDSSQYPVPGTPASAEPWTNYDRQKSPVVCVAGCPNSDPNNPNHYVILSASPAMQSNYPIGAISTSFAAVASGQIHTAAGTPQDVAVSYKTYATLISMQKFDSYGGTTDVVQTWEITSDGGITSLPKATVQVVATIETPKVPANSYAAFATANTCDAIYFHGNVTVDSYDSSQGTVAATTETTGGDLGSNGNLHVQGSVNVAGNLYTPRTGVGACTAGAVDGLTGTIGGNMVRLPTDVMFPLPAFSATPPTTAVSMAGLLGTPATACASLGTAISPAFPTPPGVPFVPGAWPVGNCTISGTTITIDNHGQGDITLPSVTVEAGYHLIFAGANTPGQNVNINSLTGSGSVEVDIANTAGVANQSVILKIAGKTPLGADMPVPFDLSTMDWKQNAKNVATSIIDASSLQIVYGGSANISMKGGNSGSAATVYAPNASFTMQGTQDFYGSILARTITNGGNASIHYDRRLSRDFWVAGNPMMGTFSWKKY